MLMDKLRDGAQGKVAKIIFWLIILSFALAGVGSYLNRPVNMDPAEVNGEPIKAQTLETQYRNERSRMEAQFGDNFSQLTSNPDYVKQLRHSVLDKLIDQLLLDQQARATHIRVGDEQVKNAIRAMPEFQKEGQFDNERYLNLLSRAGLTPQNFSESIRQDLVRQNWTGGLVGTEFALPGEINRIDALLQQTRDVTLYRVPVAPLMDKITVSDEEIQSYYKAHEKQFMQPDQVKVNYLLLDVAALQKDVKVTDQDIKDYYDQHQDLYRTHERRHVAHILIADKTSAGQKQADELLAKLNAGADFAKLAADASADKLSARKGGELDWFEKGVMDPAFDQAAFALAKTGDLSAVVKSQFGYHIIKLLGVEAEQLRPFADVKKDVEAKLRQDKSHELLLDKQQQLADLSFENPDSLDPVAEKLGLKVQTSAFFSAASAPAPFNDAKAKQQAFSDSLREQNTNSELITLGDDKAMVLHIADFKHTAVRPLADVKNDVTAALKQSKAEAEAQKQAEQLLVKLSKGENVDADLASIHAKKESHQGLTRMSNELDANLMQTLFRIGKPDAGKFSGELVAGADADQIVMVLNKIGESAQPSSVKPMLESQLTQGKSNAEYQAVLQQARKDGKIKYNSRGEAAVD